MIKIWFSNKQILSFKNCNNQQIQLRCFILVATQFRLCDDSFERLQYCEICHMQSTWMWWAMCPQLAKHLDQQECYWCFNNCMMLCDWRSFVEIFSCHTGDSQDCYKELRSMLKTNSHQCYQSVHQKDCYHGNQEKWRGFTENWRKFSPKNKCLISSNWKKQMIMSIF